MRRGDKTMNRRTAMRALATLPMGLTARADAQAPQSAAAWTPLFNGKDLSGWETFLGKPHKLTERAVDPEECRR